MNYIKVSNEKELYDEAAKQVQKIWTKGSISIEQAREEAIKLNEIHKKVFGDIVQPLILKEIDVEKNTSKTITGTCVFIPIFKSLSGSLFQYIYSSHLIFLLLKLLRRDQESLRKTNSPNFEGGRRIDRQLQEIIPDYEGYISEKIPDIMRRHSKSYEDYVDKIENEAKNKADEIYNEHEIF